jgi:hypothetical protein
MCAPRAAGTSAPEADVPAEATRTNPRSHPIIKDFGSPIIIIIIIILKMYQRPKRKTES